jgi:hypothetical protein
MFLDLDFKLFFVYINNSLRAELAVIEKQIYDLETTYLEDTRNIGNIFIGWDSYLSAERLKKRKIIVNEERL